MPHFDSDGVSIHYIDQGPEAPRGWPVLLIHGFASNVDMNWVSTGWVRELVASGRRVVAFDNRGHGRSEKLYRSEDYGAPVMAQDALRLMDHLGIGRTHVIGYSMGARIGTFLTLRNPDLVASLVLGGLGINLIRGMAGTGPIAHALEAPTIDDVTNPTARTFRAFAEQTKSDLRALAACIRGARDPVTAEAVAAIACPVLVAVGTKDVIGGSAEGLARLIPGAQAFDIEGREHMKAVGCRTFKARVLSFLHDVEAVRR